MTVMKMINNGCQGLKCGGRGRQIIMRWWQDFWSDRNALYLGSINVTTLNIKINMVLQDITMGILDTGHTGFLCTVFYNYILNLQLSEKHFRIQYRCSQVCVAGISVIQPWGDTRQCGSAIQLPRPWGTPLFQHERACSTRTANLTHRLLLETI